ncbi:MAG: hypothetical protein K9K32_04610 [Halanaerobiales bacterium]|nr:hypothetical protein [Halanaerobiales bacterium]
MSKSVMEKIWDIINDRLKDGKWEEGDQEAIVLNDAVVNLTYIDNDFDVEVIAGEPIKYDVNLNLTE